MIYFERTKSINISQNTYMRKKLTEFANKFYQIKTNNTPHYYLSDNKKNVGRIFKFVTYIINADLKGSVNSTKY